MEELGTRDLEELEILHTQAVEKGDIILAETIAYLISEKQKESLN